MSHLNIDWRKSKARKIIIGDLQDGVLPLDENELSAGEAWQVLYCHIAEFAKVPFTQFRDRLRDHRAQFQRALNRAVDEEAAMMRDRQLHPRQTHNIHGEPVFDMSDAKAFLREDVENGLHHIMSAVDLRESRPVYQIFKLEKFRERISQEVRRQKFINYLEEKRAKNRMRTPI